MSFSPSFGMTLGKMEQGLAASLSMPRRTTPFLQQQSAQNGWLCKQPAPSGPPGAGGALAGFAESSPHSPPALSCPGGAPRYECDCPHPSRRCHQCHLCSQVLMDFHHQGITCSFGEKENKWNDQTCNFLLRQNFLTFPFL